MITSSPRSSADSANSNIQSGVRCAETTRVSNGMPSCSSISTAGCKCSKSLLLPMMMATQGEEFPRDFRDTDCVLRFCANVQLHLRTALSTTRNSTNSPHARSPNRAHLRNAVCQREDHTRSTALNRSAMYQLCPRAHLRQQLQLYMKG